MRIVLILLLVIFIFVAITPVSQPLATLEDTHQLLADLGLRWYGPGAPVIVFSSPSCGYSTALVNRLIADGIAHIDVDVTSSPAAYKAHGYVGRNFFGTTATRATPTTIIGTTVIRGNNYDAILQEIQRQNSQP